jgi:hypothetical protein
MFIFALLAAGCAPPPYGGPRGIDITWPPAETKVENCSFVVTEMRGVEHGPVNTDPVDGYGHYHLFIGTDYTACDRPYCLLLFEESAEVQIRAQLVQNDHSAYEDENGDPYEDTLLLNVTVNKKGDCDLGPKVVYDPDSGGDTGDTGDTGDSGDRTGDTGG